MRVVPVAFKGKAASLLDGGQTVHSRFGVPLDIDLNTTWRHEDQKFDELRQCQLILWDEVSMCSKQIILGVERFMRDLCQLDKPFGGKHIVFAGDFRHTLPIVKGSNMARSVSICFKNCQIRQYLSADKLITDNDIEADSAQKFSNF